MAKSPVQLMKEAQARAQRPKAKPKAKPKAMWAGIMGFGKPPKTPPGFYVKKVAKAKSGVMHLQVAAIPGWRPKTIRPLPGGWMAQAVAQAIKSGKFKKLIKVRPLTVRGGIRVGALRVTGPVIQVGATASPGDIVDTPVGTATVVATPAGNVAIPGAVPVPAGTPSGSTVQTPSGPATVTATSSGPVAVPESWAPDNIDELDPPAEGPPAEMTPAEEKTAAPEESAAAKAVEVAEEAVAEVEGKTGLSGKTLLMIGAGAALLFFMTRKAA